VDPPDGRIPLTETGKALAAAAAARRGQAPGSWLDLTMTAALRVAWRDQFFQWSMETVRS
jgi:hypothetical protein